MSAGGRSTGENSPDNTAAESQDLSTNIATAEYLRTLCVAFPLPPPPTPTALFRFWYVTLSVYRSLFLLAVAANVAAIATMIVRVTNDPTSFTYAEATTALAANLFVATVMRQEHAVNLLFYLAILLSRHTPLWLRKHAAKIYCYGGLHSGCGTSALLWYIFFTYLVVRQFTFASEAEIHASVGTTVVMLTLLVVQVTVSIFPQIRRNWHDIWERSHRYISWAAVVVIWEQIILITVASARHQDRNVFIALCETPALWFLVVITAFVIYPWLRLRHVRVEAQRLSNHAVRLWIDDEEVGPCVGCRFSKHRFGNYHGFATIQSGDGKKGHSCLISRAGDFTSSIIDNPPTYLWRRGALTTGVAYVTQLFKPVVLVATGAGIGPCLSFLQAYPQWPVRVIWCTRDPLETYGPEIVNSVLRADPNALIINTAVMNRPDLLPIVYGVYKSTNSEAVLMISNPATTKHVIGGLELRKVPAYGVVYDS